MGTHILCVHRLRRYINLLLVHHFQLFGVGHPCSEPLFSTTSSYFYQQFSYYISQPRPTTCFRSPSPHPYFYFHYYCLRTLSSRNTSESSLSRGKFLLFCSFFANTRFYLNYRFEYIFEISLDVFGR